MDNNQTIHIADALISGLKRFSDPLASVFVLMDFLSLSCGEKALLRLQQDGWVLCNDFSNIAVESDCREKVNFGDVQFSVDCNFDYFSSLPEALESHTPGSVSEIAMRFSEGKGKWQTPSDKFSWITEIVATSKYLKKFAEAAQQIFDESKGKRRFGGDAQIVDILALTTPAKGVHQFCRVLKNQDNLQLEDKPVPEALIRSSKTGFVHWSARIHEDGSHLLAVPCMVANVPWAVVVCRCTVPYWQNGISLYRDKLPRVLEGLRASAQSAFLSVVLEALEDQIQESGWEPAELNARWAEVGRYFPFAIPQMFKADAAPDTDDTELIRISGEDWVVGPSQNLNFVPLLSDERKSWGDIGGLSDTLKRAIKSRLAAEERATEVQAQNVAHEYKNLTRDVSVLADRVNLEVSTDPSLDEKIQQKVWRLSRHVKQLNKLSMALYELTRDDQSHTFQHSLDTLEVFRASLRVMLGLRSEVEVDDHKFKIEDDLSFEEAVSCLATAYLRTSEIQRRRRKTIDRILEDLLDRTPVQILLFAVAEPVRNIRVAEKREGLPKNIVVWTATDEVSGECLLYQKTIEPEDTSRTFDSKGAIRTNKILPNSFCIIDTSVSTVKEEKVDAKSGFKSAVMITRVTRIKVNGRPF